MQKLWSDEPSKEERDKQMQRLRDLSHEVDRQHGDSIARWLELADEALTSDKEA